MCFYFPAVLGILSFELCSYLVMLCNCHVSSKSFNITFTIYSNCVVFHYPYLIMTQIPQIVGQQCVLFIVRCCNT